MHKPYSIYMMNGKSNILNKCCLPCWNGLSMVGCTINISGSIKKYFSLWFKNEQKPSDFSEGQEGE